MKARKYSVEEQQALIPDGAIREAFMERDDISALPESEREARWLEHKVKVGKFREFLARCDGYVIERSEDIEQVGKAIAQTLENYN